MNDLIIISKYILNLIISTLNKKNIIIYKLMIYGHYIGYDNYAYKKKMSQSKSTKVVWKSKRQPLKLCL
jgi:hypothetical protein